MIENTRRIAELRRELAANPGSRQFYQLGELLRRDGHPAEAAEVLRAGLAHHSRYVAAWVAFGRACLEAGASAEAVTGLREALTLDAENPVAWRLLGEAYLALGEHLPALEAMTRCLELVPGDEVLQAAVEALSSATWPGQAAARSEPAAATAIPPAAGVAPLGGEPAPVEPAVEAPPVAPFEPPAVALPVAALPVMLAAAEPSAVSPPAPEVIPELAFAPPVEPLPVPPPPLAVAGDVVFGEAESASVTEEPFAGTEPLHAGEVFPGPAVAAAAGAPFAEAPIAAMPEPDVEPAAVAGDPFAPSEPAAPAAADLQAPAWAVPVVEPEVGLGTAAYAEPPKAFEFEPEAVEPAAGSGAVDADLFTVPEADQAPALLRAVLDASAGEAPGHEPAPQPASLTLARLYVQQQALGEAVGVLERLLEREPDNVEASDLLALVRDMMAPLPEAPPPLAPRERKIAALQRWLAGLTLGEERAR